MPTALRPELPPMPPRIARLPLSERGYPVPWFVVWIDGVPDFRVVDPEKQQAVLRDPTHCWVCGESMGRYKSYVAGPMCAVNRTSAEPPSHRDCATWSVMACPFLTRPHARRREAGLPPEHAQQEPPGIMLKRNPGVTMVWTIEGKIRQKADGKGGLLWDLHEPTSVDWFAEGRVATRAEIEESIATGLPALRDVCDGDPKILAELDKYVERMQPLLPA